MCRPRRGKAFKARPAIMAEWSTSKQQQKKERRARRQPAWEKAADEAFERSGAAFMMAAAAGAFGTDARLSLVVLCGIPGCGKSTLAAALKAKGFVVVCQDALGSRQKCEAAASAALARGDKVCVDRCNHTHQQRELWLALAARADPDAACLVVHLDASPAVAKKRVLGPGGTQKYATRLQHECITSCPSRTRREKTVRPKISRNDVDATETERFEVSLDRSSSPVVVPAQVMARKKHATLPAAPASLGIVDRFAKEFEPVTQPRTWRLAGAWRAADAAAAIDAVGASASAPPPSALAAPAAAPAETPADRLAAMGWPKALCEAALKKARGDEDAAVDLLLTEPAAALAL